MLGLASLSIVGCQGVIHDGSSRGGQIGNGGSGGTGGGGGPTVTGTGGSGSSTGGSGSSTGGSVGVTADAGTGPFDNLPGLATFVQFDKLPFLRTTLRALSSSSTDPNQNNVDYNNYLSVSNGESVIFDALGPGAIYRFWHTEETVASSQAQYKFYFDGETTARLTINLKDMWGAGVSPFVAPLTANQDVSSGGMVTYLPIQFQTSLKITEAGTVAAKDYYDIDYLIYPAGTAVTSFTGQEDRTAAEALWKSVGTNPNPPDATDTAVTGSATVAPGASTVLASITGPREISALTINIPGLGAQNALALLGSVRLQISWDGETTPSVNVPLGLFFGTGALNGPVRALPVGSNNGQLYCYFPMPFAQSASVRLVNGDASLTLTNATFSVTSRAFTSDFSQVGNFKATLGSTGMSTLFSATGSGHIVGVTLTSPNRSGSLEANDEFLVDGARSANIVGTGVEDFFNGAWYYLNGAFTNPLTGAPAMPAVNTSPFTMYRFMLADVVPFSSGVQLSWGNDLQTVVYYYFSSKIRLTKSDQIDPSTASSLSQHAYQTTGGSAVTLSSYFPTGTSSLSLKGNEITGQTTFTATVDPTNVGVVLRRVYDAADHDQRADVYVDGSLVGTWYVAGGVSTQNTTRFREDDFSLPPSSTTGKSSIALRLVVTSSAWDDYGYTIFSRSP